MQMLTVTTPSDREILLTRTFDAPRTVVFKVMTDPAHVTQWWGRRGYTTLVDKMDVRPGGEWRFLQRTPDGTEYGFRVRVLLWEESVLHVASESEFASMLLAHGDFSGALVALGPELGVSARSIGR